MEGTPGEEKARTSPLVMYPSDAAIASSSCKTEQFEQSVPGGDQTAGTQLVAHANQFCNPHT
jgi:hypothetical protein